MEIRAKMRGKGARDNTLGVFRAKARPGRGLANENSLGVFRAKARPRRGGKQGR